MEGASIRIHDVHIGINYAISLETGELKNHHRSQVNDFVYMHACVHIATVSYPDPAPFDSLEWGLGTRLK